MKKYFGILKNEKVKDFKIEKLLDFYIDNELFYVSHSYSLNNIEKPKIDLKPTKKVINAYYDYLKEQLSRNINRQFLLFFNDFNNRIYGLSNKEKRKIALKNFNKLYKRIKVLEASFVKREKDDNGVEQVKNMNRFDFLFGRLNGQKQQLATTENILQFLDGNGTYFKSGKFNNDLNTEQFIAFEASLKILVSLNGKYKFEEDFHFTDLAKIKKLFKKYSDTFKSFEVFLFTHKKIENFREAKLAHITSLLDALFAMKLIYNKKNGFLNYINLEHQMELTKLKHYEAKQNKQHDQRVQQFKLELQEYSAKKIELLSEEVQKPYLITSKKKNLKKFTDKDALDYLFKNTFKCN